jgi:hypothetical protein
MNPGVEDDGFLQTRAETVFQLAETAEVTGVDPCPGLDLKCDHLTVVALDYEI